MPMAELQALHKHWTESLEDQEAARDVNLEKIGELVHQLVRRKRGSVNQDVLATAIYLAQKHQALDAELHHFMRTGSRRPHTPSWNSQMSVPAAHNGAGRVRRPQRTVYCGQIFPAIPILRNRVPRVSRQDKSAYHLHCIICNESFGDHRAIFLHFPGCVEDNGNLRGYCWYHHPSIEMDKIPDALIEQVLM